VGYCGAGFFSPGLSDEPEKNHKILYKAAASTPTNAIKNFFAIGLGCLAGE
jgi:hypothetical protein